MAFKFGKFLSLFIILGSIALMIGGIVCYPYLPYRHHPLFPSVVILFVTADLILLVAAIVCLRVLAFIERRNKLGSTFFLNQKISSSTESTSNTSFQKRAALYAIKEPLTEIVQYQQEILIDKQELIHLLTLIKDTLEQPDSVDIVVTQKLIESLKLKIVSVEEKIQTNFSEINLQRFEKAIDNITLTNPVIWKNKEYKHLPKPEKEKLIKLDKKIYQTALKDLKDFVVSNKTYLAVLTLELNFLLEKIVRKKGLHGKEQLSKAAKFIYDVIAEKHPIDHRNFDIEEKPARPTTKPKLH